MNKTSTTHPLRIAEVSAGPDMGKVGVTFCPGKVQRDSMSGPWARDLVTDVIAIRDWGAAAVVTTMETHELDWVQVPDLGRVVEAHGMAWLHLPIVDVATPDSAGEAIWSERGPEVRRLLRDGRHVLFHCRGGLGRSGMMAARTLVELGWEAEKAIRAIRRVRPGAIETSAQERVVRDAREIADD